ncbi:MAG TPA: dihydroorotase [Terriglobales bacterium]|nr:dihydroorotase [Terriglobales bacterium]
MANHSENQSVEIGGSLLIRNGRVIDPAQNLDAERDVLLRDGLVAEIAEPGKITAVGAEVYDARGLVVSPGFIDLHVHLREPGQTYKESIMSGTAAAAAGGFTAVCAMPNTTPVNDSPEWTEFMQAPARQAMVQVYPIAAATLGSNGHQLTNYAELKRAGAVGVTDDGHPILDDGVMQKALKLAAEVGFPVIQHAEDTGMTAKAQMNAGPLAFRLGLRGMPTDAEARVVERDIRLVEKTGGHLHVAHLSARRSLEAVREAKKRGLHVTCEVTPHHFTLIDEDLEKDGIGTYDTRLKMNPPLRSREDRDALIAGILDGTVDAIATDHAPHAAHEKSLEFDRAPFGIIGLETSLALAITELHNKHNVPLLRIVELLSTGPARVIGLGPVSADKRKGSRESATGVRGTLAQGAIADVTIFHPTAKWNYHAEQSRSKSRNTPFDGWQLTGKPVATIIGGQVVYGGRH